ncbi:hypothetical protein [Kitasatospora sp. NPDC085879]|uniref:hypothetical protein n=1 Tax=Kitasatospora sp. NPDC085879 TaxID=3154769 RepID=UPI000BB13961|nr:hypothetical protein [Streptomyces sp. TLI_235]PBC76644.1 hypothetical protein BX265_1365 [Streptomyces sp. TLI_235]
MRMLLQASIDTEISNRMITDGKMPEVLEQLLGLLKPEASYFYALHGRRGFTMVVDLPDEASLITMIEPLWVQLGADIEVVPCVNADELRTGLGRLAAQS